MMVNCMNKSLATFMMLAFIAIMIVTLLFSVVFDALEQKNNNHEEMLKTEHQLKFK